MGMANNYLLTSSSKFFVSTSTLRFTSTFDDAKSDDKDEAGSSIFFFLLAKNDRMSTGADAMLYLFKSPKMREERKDSTTTTEPSQKESIPSVNLGRLSVEYGFTSRKVSNLLFSPSSKSTCELASLYPVHEKGLPNPKASLLI